MTLDTFWWLLALLAVIVVAGSAAWAGWRAAPYVPTRQRDVERMLALAKLRPGEFVYDLGAGDGRFVLSAAKLGARAIGYEISFLPYWVAKLRLAVARLGANARMEFRDFYHQSLADADVVVCFLTPAAMAKLAPKFSAELRAGTRIVSYAFALPGWTPIMKDKPTPGTMAVYVYQR
ncbi:MAG: SAM-dependent methyltransferase [Candidatus Kerfeldbacteria bacterium]|nr:SAM-dependent methyltransferase [Candidatus Kerfeldbacteria bacterium]